MLQGASFQVACRVALACVLVASMPLGAGESADASSVYEFTVSGIAATPIPWSVSESLGIDRGLRLLIELSASTVARVDAEATLGTVHLYRESSGPASAPTYVLGDPLPAGRKSLSLAQDAIVRVDPGPGALYEIHVTVRGFYADPAGGGSAPIQVRALPPEPCMTHPLLACPP